MRKWIAATLLALWAETLGAQLVISDVTARPGDLVDVIVSMANNEERFVALSLDVILPDVLDPGARVDCSFIETHNDGGAFIVARSVNTSQVRLIALAFETTELPLPIGELVRCRVAVPIDVRPGQYVIGCTDAHAAICPSPSDPRCADRNYPVACPPALAVIEPALPPSPTPTVAPEPPTVTAQGEPSPIRVELSGLDGAGCQLTEPQDSLSTVALFAIGLLVAFMVYPRGR